MVSGTQLIARYLGLCARTKYLKGRVEKKRRRNPSASQNGRPKRDGKLVRTSTLPT